MNHLTKCLSRTEMAVLNSKAPSALSQVCTGNSAFSAATFIQEESQQHIKRSSKPVMSYDLRLCGFPSETYPALRLREAAPRLFYGLQWADFGRDLLNIGLHSLWQDFFQVANAAAKENTVVKAIFGNLSLSSSTSEVAFCTKTTLFAELTKEASQTEQHFPAPDSPVLPRR